MVFYFTSSSVNSSAYTIYMGKDKYENEDLIKYGWPEDIWFHVDRLSSAHVYLRLHKGETIEDIPKEVLMDCAHLVKANSIQDGSCATCKRTEN
uniref:Coiled-coil domain-containing protein 25 n=1 Tax=Equus asinus TaxID=9793 RepID=A0A9L0IGV7_EQUAS